jgi:hypothetical protein
MELKCPFAAPITSGQARCQQAQEVVRRGGSEYDCQAPAAHDRCAQLHARLKAVGLAEFQVEDDLTTMPHSVLVKIQSGGLAGLQRLAGAESAAIEDIEQLVERTMAQFGGLEAVPIDQLAADMTGFKLERRTRRRA